MPFQDLIQMHIPAGDITQVNSLMDQIEGLIQAYLRNLTPDENNEVGSINEQNKLLVNKVRDYQINQPALASSDVDWVEFQADYDDRQFLEAFALRMLAMVNALTETRRLHDHDNYQNSLVDYSYTKYKMGTDPGLGYDTKYDELKQFFPATGTGGGSGEPTP